MQHALEVRARIRLEEAEDPEASAEAALHALLDAELAQDAASVAARRKATEEALQVPARMADRHWLVSCDHGLQSVRDYGLAAFLPRRKLHVMTEHEMLYTVTQDRPGGGTVKKPCISNEATGERYYTNIPNILPDKNVDWPVWHCSVDHASAGMPALQFLKTI